MYIGCGRQNVLSLRRHGVACVLLGTMMMRGGVFSALARRVDTCTRVFGIRVSGLGFAE